MRDALLWSGRVWIWLIVATGLSACDRGPSYNEQHRTDEERHARLNPPGRYQMLAAQDNAVFVLDTGDGSIRHCRPEPSDKGFHPMVCGPAASQ